MSAADVKIALADPGLGEALKLGQGTQIERRKAVDQLTRLGNNGNVIADTAVCGLKYADPYQRDVTTAAIWCRRAAERGYGQAEFLLGMLCRDDSYRITQALGLQWLELARRQGIATATPVLASAYARGIGTDTDLEMAQALIAELARTETADGFYARSAQYRRGIGVGIDVAKADLYLHRAATEGNWLAQHDEGYWRAQSQHGLTAAHQDWIPLQEQGVHSLLVLLSHWQPQATP